MTGNRFTRWARSKDEGFTLIELLVVIIIIGILAAIAIPIFMNQRIKAVDASIRSDLRTIADQLETYQTNYLSYPVALGGNTYTQSFDMSGENVMLSPNVNVTIVFGTGTSAGLYAVCGWASSSSAKSATDAWVFNSGRGGLQVGSPQPCPAAGAIR